MNARTSDSDSAFNDESGVISIGVAGFVLLLQLLENYLNIFCKFKGARKLLKNEKLKKTP